MSEVMVLDLEDTAWFYRVENGQPKLFANWMIGSLALQDKTGGDDVMNPNMDKLQPVTAKMQSYLDQLTPESWHMPLEGDLDNPNQDWDDEE